MSESFGNWLADQLNRRGWTHNELARRARVSQPAVSGIVGGRKPSADLCIKIAQVLGEAPEKVLRLAGILPPLPASEDHILQELIDIVRSLPPEDREELLKYARFRSQRKI